MSLSVCTSSWSGVPCHKATPLHLLSNVKPPYSLEHTHTQIWDRSDDQVYLEEERNRELEAMFEADVERDTTKGMTGGGSKGKEDGEGEGGDGAWWASKRVGGC